MGARVCDREADVRRMVRNRTDDAALRTHAARCAACRETLEVAAWMQQMAALPIDDASLPDPMYLWWKAKLLRQWDAERLVQAPIEAWSRVAVAVGLAGAAVLLVLLWEEAPRLATYRTGGDRSSWTGVAGSMMPVLIASALLLVATAIVMVRDWMDAR
jgi:hypothetical protein